MADVRQRGFQKRSALREAENLIAQRVKPLEAETIPYVLALGRVLAEAVVSPRAQPPFRRSAMDGFAVRSQDTPGELSVWGELRAEEVFEGVLGHNQSIQVMTGASVPEGADAIVKIEDADFNDGEVAVPEIAAGKHVLQIGEDFNLGEIVVPAGRWLRPQDVAMLAQVDALEVPVRRKPRVRIVPTGNELVMPGEKRAPGQVIESNGQLLAGMILRDGGEPEVHPIVGDNEDALARALMAPGADVVVFSGGSSLGNADLVPGVVEKQGELPIHGIKVKPGGPAGIGFAGDKIVILAPGYPVASWAAWEFLGRPVMQALLGESIRWANAKTHVKLTAPVNKVKGKTEIVRVSIHPASHGPNLATPLAGGAALISTLTKADGFLLLSEGSEGLQTGEEQDAFLFSRG